MKRRTWIAIILLLLCGAALLGVTTASGKVILYLGIRSYRLLTRGLIAATGLLALTSGAFFAREKYSARKALTADTILELEQEEKKRLESRDGKLSVKGRLDAAAVQKMLQRNAEEKWSMLAMNIEGCINQMQQMDDYQARLSTLLKNNAADTLYDTEDILDQVEQTICKNARKVLNYMDVADENDAHIVKEKLYECHQANGGLLRQTQEFMFALTEFLNHQGDSGGEIDMLDVYKKTILESIRELG